MNCWRSEILKHLSDIKRSRQQVKLKQGLKIAMAISSEGNAYLQVSFNFRFYSASFTLHGDCL